MNKLFPMFLLLLLLFSCKDENEQPRESGELEITFVYVGDSRVTSGINENIAIDKTIDIQFNSPLDISSVLQSITLKNAENQTVEIDFAYFNQNKMVKLSHADFDENATYTLILSSNLKGINNETFSEQTYTFSTLTIPLVLETILIDGNEVNPRARIKDIGRNPVVKLQFNTPVSGNEISQYSTLKNGGVNIPCTVTRLDEKSLSVTPEQTLNGFSKFEFNISSEIETQIGKPFEGLDLNFYTQVDSSYKFPEISDDELLTLVQQQTFKYFWDFAHPVSGMARERNTSDATVTSGGSGFGVMAIVVAIERGFISREEGVGRLETIVDFLTEADRFHGAWPHWMNGTSGKIIPFSANDDGGDLVETAFMIQGLLTARQYLNATDTQESQLVNKINALWETVEWNWYTQGGQDVLYWHWSPNNGWEMNMPIKGWNEALITYVLAASSTTHSIDTDVYTKGWAQDGAIKNTGGNSYYGYTLPLRSDMGGPLFFSHYSFLGLDPRNLSDQFANYWTQNVTHSKINNAYCADNPQNYVGYSARCWGLTASDGFSGYSAHSPNNDKGVITPTAALSSMPYTPEESMEALRFFYYILGDKLCGEYGFYDAFDVTNSWTANSFLAIDQGPIIVMIENYRTNLLWDLFMSCPEVQSGLTKLGFTY